MKEIREITFSKRVSTTDWTRGARSLSAAYSKRLECNTVQNLMSYFIEKVMPKPGRHGSDS